MQVLNSNNVKIYSITSASKSAIPDWLAKSRSKELKQDSAWRNRVELIQDFYFPEASLRIQSTRDGNYVMATGVYKPQMRVYDLAELSLKFERHSDCENVAFEILTDDWTKSVMLQADRTIELHASYGLHYKTRIPKFGRAIKYHHPSCDLLIGGASNQIWRLNLDQGRFMTSFDLSCTAVNAISINPSHQLFAFGGEDGKVEFWDPRCRKRIGILDVTQSILQSVGSDYLESVPEVSALQFSPGGLSFAVGSSTGQILTYDLRSSTPILTKDHQYGLPIKNLEYHTDYIVSADSKIIKIWDKESGTPFTSVEPPSPINDICLFGDSGLLMVANEGIQVQSYYIPTLGPAPKWCPFLDNLTEELEESPNATIYDDYKFVTRQQLTTLGLEHLVGTSVLKAYMHGFFMDLRLYEKARSIANPFEYEEYKRSLVAKKLEAARSSRIAVKKRLPKVNAVLASKLLSESSSSKKKKAIILNATSDNPLGDDRFKSMFSSEDYEVDTTSHEYKIHHPSEAPKKHIETIEQGDDDDLSSEPEGRGSDLSTDDESDEDDDAIRFQNYRKGSNKRLVEKPRFLEMDSSSFGGKSGSGGNAKTASFETRLKSATAADAANVVKGRKTGNMSITFNVAAGGGSSASGYRGAGRNAGAAYQETGSDGGVRKPRRSVSSLGLSRGRRGR